MPEPQQIEPSPLPSPSAFVPIRQVAPAASLRWLRAGWHDLMRAPAASLAYGLAFAAMGALIGLVFRHAYQFASALAAGFLLVGPFLAAGLYDISRRLERGTDTVNAALTSVRALIANPLPLAIWAALIVLLIGFGFATVFVGLVVTAPIVGHATWHAYRELVE